MVPTLFPLRNLDLTVESSVNVKRGRDNETLKPFKAVSHFHVNYAYFAVLRPEKFRNASRAADDYAYHQLVSLFLENRDIFKKQTFPAAGSSSSN